MPRPRQALRKNRRSIHSVNGANPLTGSESRAGNFDHYNSFTEHSLKQVFLHAGYVDPEAIPLNLYVFFRNPLNYVAWALATLSFVFFRAYKVILDGMLGALIHRPQNTKVSWPARGTFANRLLQGRHPDRKKKKKTRHVTWALVFTMCFPGSGDKGWIVRLWC